MNAEVVKALLAFLKERWYHPAALGALLLLVALLSLYILTDVDFSELSPPRMGILSAVLLIACGLWYWTTHIPRTPRNHIGFLIAISADKKEYQHRIKHDFVETLKSLLRNRQGEYQYHFIDLPEYHARKIVDHESALTYKIKTRSTFVLFGRARQRILRGKEHHIFNLDGIVGHRQVPTAISRRLGREFREVLPRDVKLHAEDDLLVFEFSAQWVTIVAQYIVGIASYLSLNFEYAEQLFWGLREQWQPHFNQFPVLRKISQRLPVRLAEVHGSSAGACYNQWRATRSIEVLIPMKHHLDRLQELDPTSYSGHLLRAIWYFVSNRDTRSTIAEIRCCKNYGLKDATWRYSYAFLLAYQGEMQQALQQYKIALTGPIGPRTSVEIEDFLLWVIEQEPQKVDMHFCLGMVNHYLKDDSVRALEEFTAYLNKTDGGSRECRNHAAQCVRELRAKLGTEEPPDA